MQIYLNSTDEERRALIKRSRGGDMTVSNKEVAHAFEIDPTLSRWIRPIPHCF
ncbi:MAG: hypothetical protein AAF529_24120 [Pseudomonadota bacterium]